MIYSEEDLKILMCEKAEEIQNLWERGIGDFFYRKGNTFIVSDDNFGAEDDIWLPREDQLQKMVLKDGEKGMDLFIRFHDWCLTEDTLKLRHEIIEYSMDQLWLGFVMHEEYQKTWNGEAWVKDG